MNGAELLVKTAIAAGIEVCFANVGTTEITLVAALGAVPGIRSVPTLFEGVCTGAADGYGRMLDKPAMTLLHLGLGLANGVANLHNAKRAGTPVFNVVGQHATWHLAWDSAEVTDIEGLAAPVSGWLRTSATADAVSRDTADAVTAALQGQVAVLIMPQDCQWGEVADQTVINPDFSFNPVDENSVKEAAELLRKGPTALLFLGGRALRRRGLFTAARIKAATGCDILTETLFARMEKGAGIPAVDRLPYFPEAAVARLSAYQNVVFAGAGEPIATFGYKGGRSQLLSIDDKRVCTLTGDNQDPEEVLDCLADLLDGSKPGIAVTGLEKSPAKLELPKGRLTVDAACWTLAALQPEGAIIVDESVTSGGPYHGLSVSSPPHTVLALTGGAIGQGMPCATGAAIACPDRPVINFQADGSAMFTLQSLWTQAREGLDVTTLICSNRSYDILKIELARAGYVPLSETAEALTDLGSPPLDWVKLSRGMGVPAVSVASAEDLAKELAQALREPGPHLIEMVLTR
jgi:acetolactate synthase I/II/III large subunit